MSHRPLRREDFEGKTIQAVDVRAINIIRFRFTDGSSIAIEHERDGMVACDECATEVALTKGRGPRYPVTKRWREQVRERLARMRCSQAEMARQLGAPGPSVSWVLSQPISSSYLVPAIEAFVGMANTEPRRG